MPSRPPVVLLMLALSGVACDRSRVDWTPPPGAPEVRPVDGLLTDGELQSLVELQSDRNAEGLIARLSSDRATVRARAALALGSVQSMDAVPELSEALSDADAGVRRDAAFALGQAGGPEAVRALTDALPGEVDRAVRARILEALGKLPGPESLAALLSAEVDADEESGWILALARLGAVGGVFSEASVASLAERLAHEDPGVRLSAAYFFGRAPSAVPWARVAPRVRHALREYGRSEPAAIHLVQALGRLGEEGDLPVLLEWATRGRDWRIRVNAVAAAGGLEPDPKAVEAFVRLLDDPSEHVALAAARALAAGEREPETVRRIVSWVAGNGRPWRVAEPLMPLLARMDEREAVLAWVDGLDPADAWSRAAGMRAVALLPGRDMFERLEAASSSPDTRTADDAVRALGVRWRTERHDERRHPDYLRVFAAALDRPELGVAGIAAEALADSLLGGTGVALLAEAYARWRAPADGRRMRAVLRALGASGASGADAVLARAVGDEDPEIREAASAALAELRGQEQIQQSAGAPPRGPSPLAPEARLDWAYLASLGEAPRLVLDTDRGRIVVRLDPEGAPLTVQTVARFVEQGRYDGVAFHRVVSNFVIQSGDFSRGDGSGGPGFSIRSELNLTPYLRGTIGMASAGKDTEGSQFFITHSMQPHLEGGYTSFGWVVEGMEVVDRILVGDRIVRAAVEHGR